MNVLGRIAIADPAGTLPKARVPRASWRPALIALGLGLAAWAALFSDEIDAAVRVWNSSTAYNHCWLILPIAAWLFWQRRERLAFLAPVPAPLLALLAIPGTLAWLAAERLGVMEGRQLVAFGLFQVLVLSVLGWRFSLAFAGPLAYLVFLVPFGAFAEPMLQQIAARLIAFGLSLTDIPHYIDGLLIEIPAGLFHVAEACAGLRFIIASLAFGALYALVIFRSPWRRLLVMVLAVVVPLLANGMRALGIVLAGHYLGSAEAAAADHIVAGWAFFAVVMLLLILAGLPFREDGAPHAPVRFAAPATGPARPAMLAAALLLAVALTGAGPAVAGALVHESGRPQETRLRLSPAAGCVSAPDGLALECAGSVASATMHVFSPRTTWNEVSAVRWRQIGSDTDLTFRAPIAGGGGWEIRQSAGAVAIAAWLDGRVVGHGLATRARQARNSLLGGGGRPVLVVVTLLPASAGESVPPARIRFLLETILAAQEGTLTMEAAARSQGR